MGALGRIIGVAYIAAALVSVYAIVQTSMNYAMVIETEAKFSLEAQNLTLATGPGFAYVNFTVGADNPSRLPIRIEYVEYTIWLYNKSSELVPFYPLLVYNSYSKIAVVENSLKALSYDRDISARKSILDNATYIQSSDAEPRLFYNMQVTYTIPDFPDWGKVTAQTLNHQESSKYG